MTAQLIEIKPTILEEFYLNKDFIEKHCVSKVYFSFEITPSWNNIRSFQVSATYEAYNHYHDLVSKLTTLTEFDLFGISSDAESFKTLEQCIYIAYSELLKQHKERYRNWASLNENIDLPNEQLIAHDLNKFLHNLLH